MDTRMMVTITIIDTMSGPLPAVVIDSRAETGFVDRMTALRSRIASVVVVLSLSGFTSPAMTQPYTLDDWMSISTVDAFEWSKDGQSFYYTSNAAPTGTADLFRIDAMGGEPLRLGRDEPGVRPEPKHELTLSPDGKQIFFTAARYFQAFVNIFRMPVSGGQAEALTFNDAVIQTSPGISPDGNTLTFYARTGAGAKIYTQDLRDSKAWPRLLFPGKEEEITPVWSASGSLAFQRGGDIWVLAKGGTDPVRIIDTAYGGGNGSFAWSPAADRIAFTNSKSGFDQIGVVDVATSNVTPITNEPNEHGEIAWSPDGNWLAYIRNDDVGMSNDVVLTRANGTGQPRILTRDKGFRKSPRFSPDGKQIAFTEATSVRTRDIWVVDISSGRLTQITRSMGRIDPESLSPAQEVSYAGQDNLSIPSMLWLPPQFDPRKKYPVIVRLHGHPGQWNHDFEMMTQYFVNQGFVAIAPNPRGSNGFGQGFHDLHIADYGGTEFKDVMAVLPYLKSLGYVDMERKATWGGSGGGYMNLVIATEAPDAFEAQIIRAPVSSWRLLAYDRFGASARAWTATRAPRRERSEFGGSYADVPEEYDDRSPINFVEAVTIPQLLFHGMRDTSVLPRQSEVWVKRMQELGKGDLIEYVQYPDEDHGLQRYKATVRDRIARMSGFLSVHLDLPDLRNSD